MNESGTKAEVWAAVQAMNRLWTFENRPDELADCFHERMIAIVGSELLQLEGRDACVAGWSDFSRRATMHSWKEIDPKIEIFGDGTFAGGCPPVRNLF